MTYISPSMASIAASHFFSVTCVSYAESHGGVLAVVALVVVSVCILASFDAAKVGGLRYCLHMAFAIQWTGPLGPATTERDEAAAALVSAMELAAKGYMDVVIIDLAEGGKAYAPADFVKFVMDARS